MKVMVTGGAGYIGTHTCMELLAAGHVPVVVDNFCNSRPEALALARVRAIAGREFPVHEMDVHEMDVRDREGLRQVFAVERPDAVPA